MIGTILVSYLLLLLSLIFLGTGVYEYTKEDENYKYVLSIGLAFLILAILLFFNFLRFFS